MTKELFWINTNSSTEKVGQTTKAQRSIVQSQVQRGRPRKRKSKSKSPSSASTLPAKDVDKPKELYDPAVRSMSAEMDPFDTACVPIDMTAKGLLRYYVHRYHPSQWPGLPFAPKIGAYSFKTSVDRILSVSVEDQLMMYSLLTATSSRLQHTDRLCYPNVAKREDQYTQQALQLVRERVNGNANVSGLELSMLLQCITFLTSAESYRGNYSAAAIHLAACLSLLEPHGGIMQLQDSHVQGQILMGDLFLACVNLEPCLCGCDYDPGPAFVLDLQPYELSGTCCLEHGTKLLCADALIAGHFMQTLVEQILETHYIKTNLNTTYMNPSRVLEIGQWVTMRNMAARNQLLGLELADFRMHALRAALVMWTLLAMNYTGRVTTVKVMANKLRAILEETPEIEWMGHEGTRLWILLLGYNCSAEGSETLAWFIAKICRVTPRCADIDLFSWSDSNVVQQLEHFQRSYLYHAPIQHCFTEQIGAALLRTKHISEPMK
ncbi:hypothetical protein HII31_12038 [Pseudocercospora fuligena]|uniref:Transcription factor domain-containing protein n=1 Tax=Pseudocercospora fuligena TaxID=685502 RepID=A0A8H6VFW2_9PEZI|nr:hypothetical protein HII31_12038 [Pseudocercospora fuligena]